MSHWESKGKSDEWYTPKYVFDALGVEFDTDVASPEDRSLCHVPAKQFITSGSLQKQWIGFVWMNPPFSGRNGKSMWLNKIHNHGNGIALTPDRTSAPWWPVAASQADCFLLITGKVKFIKQDGSLGKQPGTGTTLFAYGDQAVQALKNAEKNGLGILLYKMT